MKKVLVFDFDGVIADSFDASWKFYNKNCEKHGLKKILDKEKFVRLFDGNFFQVIYHIGMSPFKFKKLALLFKTKLSKEYDNIETFPDIKEVVNILGKRYKIIFVSSNFGRLIRKYLKKHKVKFDYLIGADKEKSKAVKIKSIAIKHKGASLFYIGDTVGDMIEGKKAGVKTIAVTWGYHNRQRLERAKPSFIADKPKDLFKIIDG